MKNQLRIIGTEACNEGYLLFFIKGQSEQRTINRTLDWKTLETAMRTKISDVKMTLKKCLTERANMKL